MNELDWIKEFPETAQLLARMLEPRSPPVSIDPAFDEYDSDVIRQTFAATLPPSELAQAGWPALHTDRRQFQLFLERAARPGSRLASRPLN